MSNIMQYLLQMSDELNDKYEIIDKRIDNILDKLEVLIIKNDVSLQILPNKLLEAIKDTSYSPGLLKTYCIASLKVMVMLLSG